MYLTRTRPMMRDRKVEAISTSVAVKPCACDGATTPGARIDRVAGEGSVRPLPLDLILTVLPLFDAQNYIAAGSVSKRPSSSLSLATGHSADELAFLWTETAHSSFVN